MASSKALLSNLALPRCKFYSESECTIRQILRQQCYESLGDQFIKLIIAYNKAFNSRISLIVMFVCACLLIHSFLTLDEQVCWPLGMSSEMRLSNKRLVLARLWMRGGDGVCRRRPHRRHVFLVRRVDNATRLRREYMSIPAAQYSWILQWHSRWWLEQHLDIVY